MICFPNAKINIGLNITGRRPDGFHIIETILYPIELCDVLEFVENENTGDEDYRLNCTGIELKTAPEENICIKAYKLLKKDFDLPGISIHLHKIIPVGAGLGGGSSDAAYMLKNLNKEFRLNISNKKLFDYASRLGSDCPFFINNKPVFAYETGTKFKEIDLTPKGNYIIIVYPGIQISTGHAYSKAFIKKPEKSLQETVQLPLEEWKNVIKNDFENTIFPKYPELKNIKKDLYDMGALYASMSGSGSALYGIFDAVPEIKMSLRKYFVWQYKI
ncbi:MAG: 4-(cytidine 5'-diphospho)-2-C-methyl-D-erythritol kinase [Bacteroidales bacterium]|nr:MAG: 4-(cytidine 5'-diphospho)-2-C-methyl-D-erythritol kinase [Bacteroidales bacterium]